jgi:YrbI family 3-deoxy-D-manno-octulosonate 8-phosphate phosphatase
MNNKAKKIKFLVMDVDGVLTDAGMYYTEKGDELKKFNTRDGMGIGIWHKAGFKTAIITLEKTDIVEWRAAKLGISEVHQGIENKLNTLEKLVLKYNLSYEEIAYVGDDVNDIPVLEKVGFSAAPQDAIEEVKEIVDYVTEKKGGEGVVRDVITFILNAKSKI